MELPLPGCSITYIPKDGKKKKHELKITQQGTDPLVLAVQSKEQAEQWLRVSRRAVCGARPTLVRGFPACAWLADPSGPVSDQGSHR